ncbi:aluminum-activated malate transporter 8-like [Nicotiana tomentosiformis]|uniref:aluminum-activated malate transporter 8-like n=1 Tax=Nicotiana tomentosiformis TaxID=4098 RepID=UPI00051BE455|nr:aluminum-activated malate transporter 8-like [Nicotiana tomentosiformis]
MEKTNVIAHFMGFPGKLKDKVMEIVKKTMKIGKDDPRKIWHAAKVGLALTLVSLFYYFRPLYDGFGQSAIWAVLTVVVVFEFTAGATLSKCLNRGFATLLAGALGIGAKYFADLFGKEGEPIVLGFLIFTLGAVGTFTRFFPHMKRKYDYGILIFVLTFSLVTVSGYRVDEILELAHQRLTTILVGAATCMIISLVVCPVWAGEDLHKLVCGNLDKLATFLEGFGSEYFSFSEIEESGKASKEDKGFLQAYKIVLNSKATEETLANFAWWEPGHGSFRLRHPWKQYLKIGVLARECACHLQALTSYFNSNPQAPTEFHKRIEEACTRMSMESSKALKQLASSIKTMTQPPSSAAETHLKNSKTAIDDFKAILATTKTPLLSNKLDLLEIFPAITVASILIDVINCVERISEAVEELSVKAHFKKVKNKESSPSPEKQPQQQLLHRGIVKPVVDDVEGGDDSVVIEICGGTVAAAVEVNSPGGTKGEAQKDRV